MTGFGWKRGQGVERGQWISHLTIVRRQGRDRKSGFGVLIMEDVQSQAPSSRNFTAEVVRFSVFRKAEGKSLCLVFILIRSSWLTELFTGFRTQPSGSLDLMPLKHRPLNPGSTSRTTEPSWYGGAFADIETLKTLAPSWPDLVPMSSGF